MEDTIQKGEREPEEEIQSENERIVEEFLRQNQESDEPEEPVDDESGSDKVIQWVEQAGADPASHASEVPELYSEFPADEAATLVPDVHIDEAVAPALDEANAEQVEHAEEPRASEGDASALDNSMADQPVGLGDLAYDVTEAETELSSDDQTSPAREIPVLEDAASPTMDLPNEEPLAEHQTPEDDGNITIADFSPTDEPEQPWLNPEDEGSSSTPEIQVDVAPTPVADLPVDEAVTDVQVLGDVEPEPPIRKIALILSGGGAKGAFQVGAEKYAREVKGYHWDIIAGVSVGAMNGAMLSMHRYRRLLQIWDTISDEQVYTGGFNLISLVKLALGSKSFFSNAPLQKLMQGEFEAGRIIDDLHVGAVSLHTGEYVQFTRESLELAKAILASASIPVVWPPVDISAEHAAMVDGGVRNITPVGDVLDLEPDEIVIINCGPERPPLAPSADANVLSIGLRALDLMQNEIFINDMKTFLRINALVQEAENQGCFLHHPKTGKLLKYYPCQLIEPDAELGDTLDFSQKSVQAGLRAGVRRAREVLGRP